MEINKDIIVIRELLGLSQQELAKNLTLVSKLLIVGRIIKFFQKIKILNKFILLHMIIKFI